MKIALIVRNYTRIGGVSRTVADLAAGLLAGGHRITVYCANRPQPAPPAIEFVQIPLPRGPYALRAVLFPRRASRVARRGDHDIIHGQGNDCFGADVITAHSCHRYAIDYMRRTGDLHDRIKKTVNPVHPLIFLNERCNYSPRGHRRIIAVSARVKQEVIATYGVDAERITVIYNSVDLRTFSPAGRDRARREIRRRYRIGDDPLLLFVGYEFERKGLALVLAAIKRMRRRDARLLVVGKGRNAYAAGLARRHGLSSRVVFAGAAEEIADFYRASDLFVFPTRYEPFGLVITEAMASGLPVVTTEVAGAAELIQHDRSGLLLATPPDPDRLARLLDRLLSDERQRSRIARQARRTVEERCSPEAMTRAVLDVYAAVREEQGHR